MSELKKLVGRNGKTLLWSQDVKPRTASGDIGNAEVVVRFEVGELAHAKEIIKSDATSRKDFELDLKRHLGVDVVLEKATPTAQADKTPVNKVLSDGVTAWFQAGQTEAQIIEAFKKSGYTEEQLAPYCKSLQAPSVPQVPKP